MTSPSARLHLIPLLLAACLTGPARAQDLGSGVVTSQTVTIAGQDFSQYFIAAWREQDGSDNYTIAIRERPSARWGSEVWIEYAHRNVFHTRLPASRAALRALGGEAAGTAFYAVLEEDVRRKLSRELDLAPDEF